MSLMLKRGIEALVGTALVVAILLAVSPAVAEAQSTAKGGAAAERAVVVVSPGDSLWSISAERLGPNATAQQIAKGTERIYALNRDRIGADPNLIIVGQRLSLPQETDGRAVAHLAKAKATSTPPSVTREGAGEGAGRAAAAATPAKRDQEANSGATAVRGETSQASTTIEAVRAAATKGVSKAPEDAARPVSAERQAGSEDSPLASLLRSVRSVVSSAPSAVGDVFTEVRAAVTGASRTTLGWMVLVLTVVVGAFMAWKLPMRRTTRWDAERWGIPTGYYGGGGRFTSSYYSGNLDMRPTAEQLAPAARHRYPILLRDLQEGRLHHESLAGVALGQGAKNGTGANGSEAQEPLNGGVQAARRRVYGRR